MPRASFVVTLALLGCGGQVNESSENVGNPPPADSGAAGDVASIDGHHDGSDAATDVPTSCPPTDPVVGTPCALTSVTYCDYSKCDSTGGRGKAYECVAGKWVEAPVPSCNPPPVCPKSEPTPGSSCATSGFGTCAYADTCASRPASASPSGTDVFQCSGGTWKLVSTDYALPCPAFPPGDATPCGCGVHTKYEGGSCSFCGAGGHGISALCDPAHDMWIEDPFSCGPPDPDAGVDADASGAEASTGEVGPAH